MLPWEQEVSLVETTKGFGPKAPAKVKDKKAVDNLLIELLS